MNLKNNQWIKYAFFDIDGTLTKNTTSKKVSLKTIETLQKLQQKNIHVVLVTGRSFVDVQKLFEAISISKFAKYVITSGGSQINEIKNPEPLFLSFVDSELLKKIISLCKRENILFKLSNSNKVYYFKINYFKKIFYNLIGFVPTKASLMKEEDWKTLKILLTSGFFSKKKINKIWTKINQEFFNEANFTFTTKDRSIEITNINVNKGTSLEKLAKKESWDLNNAIAFGDSMNDVPMFKRVGFSVSMENGSKQLQKISTDSLKNCRNDSIAKYLIDFFGL